MLSPCRCGMGAQAESQKGQSTDDLSPFSRCSGLQKISLACYSPSTALAGNARVSGHVLAVGIGPGRFLGLRSTGEEGANPHTVSCKRAGVNGVAGSRLGFKPRSTEYVRAPEAGATLEMRDASTASDPERRERPRPVEKVGREWCGVTPSAELAGVGSYGHEGCLGDLATVWPCDSPASCTAV